MIILLFMNLLSYAHAREFPDKEIIRRCDFKKVQSCVEEHQQLLNSAVNDQNSAIGRQNRTKEELEDTQRTSAPIDDELAKINESQSAIDSFLAEKIVEKIKFQPIFFQGPTLLETKLGQPLLFFSETPDYNSLRSILENDKIDLEKKRHFLASEQLYLANRIRQLQTEIANTTQSILDFESKKRQHGQMCDFGCKQRFCPEN